MTFIKSKLGNVIDVQGASKNAGAPLDAWPQKSSDNDNQQWEFVPDPDGSGYFFIKSSLDGNVIDIQENSDAAGALLDAFPQKSSNNRNQLWSFVPDPAGSGYYFIPSALDGNVVDVQGGSSKDGALLDAFPQHASNYDNQLWAPVDGTFPPPLHNSLSWGPEGTGPPPNGPTAMSGSNEAAYQVSVTINEDGSCTFSGYYQNRGDVPIVTAPPQSFNVGCIVLDTFGHAYSFTYSGNIPSAPQAGSLVKWDIPQKCPVIADNWYAIAAKNHFTAFARNSTDMSIGDFLSSFWTTYGSDIETGIEDAGEVIAAIAAVAG